MIKRMFSVLLAALMTFSLFMTVSAEAATYDDGFIDQGGFVTHKERIEDDGTYWFTIREEAKSKDEFIPSKNTITLTAKGRRGSTKDGSLYPDDSISYTVTVYNSDTDESVGSISATADGKTKSQKITVVAGQQYYLIATCSPTLTNPSYLRLDGRITKNITVIR